MFPCKPLVMSYVEVSLSNPIDSYISHTTGAAVPLTGTKESQTAEKLYVQV